MVMNTGHRTSSRSRSASSSVSRSEAATNTRFAVATSGSDGAKLSASLRSCCSEPGVHDHGPASSSSSGAAAPPPAASSSKGTSTGTSVQAEEDMLRSGSCLRVGATTPLGVGAVCLC